ncbi:MAG: hypothetical protein B6U88_01650 [Candidatus Aenigmarchaeota archaeon ex4484_56]|nr:MAG: hypothetical protein B6U88_01650 [Candidatus Aenigmarchaeota archaeon ex4484_56]
MVDIFKVLENYGGGNGKYLGKIIAVPPLGQDEVFNFTLPMGKATGLWVGFLSWLDKKGYKVKKVNETLDISSVDSQYYSLTQRHKEELESKIKQGLISVAQTVSDYELLQHDFRKYKEFLKFIETNDEHSLRAVFIDEVDINTGANSMKQMVVRWPTIIADFMKLGEEMPKETDVNKISEKLKISKVEAVILSTKQRLYLNWKEMFGSEVKRRCENLIGLLNSRKKTIEEYRNWLKPTIAKHKIYKEGLEESSGRIGTLTSQWSSPGQAVSTNEIEVWAWQPIISIENRRGTLISPKDRFGIEPYDNFIKEKIIFSDNGLKGNYPWITEKWVNKVKGSIEEMMNKSYLYYVLLRIKYTKAIIKTPTGIEIEDVVYETKNWFLSQNALFVLLLDIRAREEELERYIDQILGLSSEDGTPSEELEKIIKKWKEEEKEKDKKEKFENIRRILNKIKNTFGLDIAFSKFGPYEHNFKDRITNIYLVSTGVDFYVPVVKYLLDGAGVGN